MERFWVAGKGWVLLGDLKPGDVTRSLSGLRRVTAVEDAGVSPVCHVRVGEGRGIIVGQIGILAHGEQMVRPVVHAFDTADIADGSQSSHERAAAASIAAVPERYDMLPSLILGMICIGGGPEQDAKRPTAVAGKPLGSGLVNLEVIRDRHAGRAGGGRVSDPPRNGGLPRRDRLARSIQRWDNRMDRLRRFAAFSWG